MIVFLDTNILGLLSNENDSFDECLQCKKWFYILLTRGVYFVTSDLCDYEVRRGLIANSIRTKNISSGIKSLDSLRSDGFLEFFPVSTTALTLAANLWAIAST